MKRQTLYVPADTALVENAGGCRFSCKNLPFYMKYCFRAVDFVCSRGKIDCSRTGLCGGSQGGGLTLAVGVIDGICNGVYILQP